MLPSLDREHVARFVSRVVVMPVGRGRRVPACERRAEVWFTGAEEPVTGDGTFKGRGVARVDGRGGSVKRAELDDFLKRHGGIEVAGDGPNGPSYVTADGWTVFLPLDRDEAVVRSPIWALRMSHTHDEPGGCYDPCWPSE